MWLAVDWMTGIQFLSWKGILSWSPHPAQCRDPPSLPFWEYHWPYYHAWLQQKLTSDLHVVHLLWESGAWLLLPRINLMKLKQRDNTSFTFMIIPFFMGFGDFDIAEIISLIFAFLVLIFTCSGQARRHEVPRCIFEKQGVPYGSKWSGSDRNTNSNSHQYVPLFLFREVDDEDEMLYGETEVPLFEPPVISEPSISTAALAVGEMPWWVVCITFHHVCLLSCLKLADQWHCDIFTQTAYTWFCDFQLYKYNYELRGCYFWPITKRWSCGCVAFRFHFTFLTWVCSVSVTNSSESYFTSFNIW